MIGTYQGNFPYTQIGVLISAPAIQGVYYCGTVNFQNQLVPMYIGRAKGTGVTINSRLSDHLRQNNWSDITHFGYVSCSTDQEAINLEASEIVRCQPKYNQVGK